MIRENDLKKLCNVIYRRTGVSIEEKESNNLEDRVLELMKRYDFSDFNSFFHAIRLDNDNTIFKDLVEIITDNERYFFKENYQFESFVNHLLPKLHKLRPKGDVIRILCAPSSTGEDPYSIALHLLNEGNLIEARDFEIIGVDKDSNVVKKAEMGLFSKESVRFVPQNILKEYFNPVGTDYEIAEFLREAIAFKQVNVMDKLAMKRLGKFDIIFSRNMFIYLDDASRREVAMTFFEMLKPRGYIFLGHNESMSRAVSVYKTLNVGDFIVYQGP